MNNESIWTKFAWGKAALLVFSLLALINILILDIKVFRKAEEPAVITPTFERSQAEERKIDFTTPSGEISETGLCPAACLEVVSWATRSAIVPTVVPTKEAKEFFISLGGGSTKAGDWEDLVGLEAYIDSSKYGKIKEVVFEAGISIPNGNQRAYARLFNVTDGHPVWNSEVSLEGGTPQLLVSSPITLSSGKKLYRVQMKTTLRDLAVLTQARVKITTR